MNTKRCKKSEMGVGTLILFIALLLVAAVAAGVLISISGSLQETSLITGDESKTEISTNINVIEITATDGRSNLNEFQQILKLSPGSDPIKLEDTLLTFNTIDVTATLVYRGLGSVCSKNNADGYNTFRDEELDEVNISSVVILAEDLDVDQHDDILFIDDAAIYINLSSHGQINISMNADISNASEEEVVLDIYNAPLSNGTSVFAYITLMGTTNVNHTIPENMTFLVVPQLLYRGYFSAIYENQGTNFKDGKLQQGDILRLCYEAPRAIGEDEKVRINIIPKTGTPTMSMFYTPQAISGNRIFLYP